MRIAFIVLCQLILVPYYMIRLEWMGKHSTPEKTFRFTQRIVRRCVKIGRVKLDYDGLENLPKENGYVLFPNHQGLFDVLVFLSTMTAPFAFVAKAELKGIPIINQMFHATHSLLMNRSDLRQSMKVIQEMIQRVSAGENFLIFAEGTRSHEGNHPGEFKAGSFKSAVKAQAPIVPCMLVDSFLPFDSKSLRKLTVGVRYLKPMYYDEYKDMTTQEIAAEVKRRVEEAIAEYLEKNKQA